MYAYQHGALTRSSRVTMEKRLAMELLQACCGAFVMRYFVMLTPFFPLLSYSLAYFP